MKYFVKAVQLKDSRTRKSAGWTMAVFGPATINEGYVNQACAFVNLNMAKNRGKHKVWKTAEEAEAAYKASDLLDKSTLDNRRETWVSLLRRYTA